MLYGCELTTSIWRVLLSVVLCLSLGWGNMITFCSATCWIVKCLNCNCVVCSVRIFNTRGLVCIFILTCWASFLVCWRNFYVRAFHFCHLFVPAYVVYKIQVLWAASYAKVLFLCRSESTLFTVIQGLCRPSVLRKLITSIWVSCGCMVSDESTLFTQT
jgi:hypothetical protein